jgi:proteasome assembly chaperone (PAC2) family protein
VEILQIPSLRDPIMLIAFSGWNDGAEAATGALDHLLSAWTDSNDDVVPVLIAQVDSEDFYDYQVSRPQVRVSDSMQREITWPGTQIFGLSIPSMKKDLVIVTGVEPSMRWKSFTREILDIADDLETSMIITIGAMLSDSPHTRPIRILATTSNPSIGSRLDLQPSNYQGPTGIIGAIQDGCTKRGIESLSLWASVPHYAPNAPSPKASLALIQAIEDYLGISIPLGDLREQAETWEDSVTQLASEDADVADYVKALEASKDAADLPEVSGETIAKEFEKYLRRHQED